MSFDSIVYDSVPGTRLSLAALLQPFASLLSYANDTKHLHEGEDRSVDTRPSQKTIKSNYGAWDRFYRAYTIGDLGGYQLASCQSGPSGSNARHEKKIEGGEEDAEPDIDGMSIGEMVDPTDMVPSNEERVIAGPEEGNGESGELETDEEDLSEPPYTNTGSCDPPHIMGDLSRCYDQIFTEPEDSGPEIDAVRFSWAPSPPHVSVKTQITDNNESVIQAFALEYNTPPSPVIVTITPPEGYPTVIIPHGRESGQWR